MQDDGHVQRYFSRRWWELLHDVTVNTPIQQCESEKKRQEKIYMVMDGLSETYMREAQGSTGKIRLLSTLAPHFKNKELKT